MKRQMRWSVWSVELYGSKSWTLWIEDNSRLETFWDMDVGKNRKDKTDGQDNGWRSVEKSWCGNISVTIIRTRKQNWLEHWMKREYKLMAALTGIVNRRRWRYQMVDTVMTGTNYGKTKKVTGNRIAWRVALGQNTLHTWLLLQ